MDEDWAAKAQALLHRLDDTNNAAELARISACLNYAMLRQIEYRLWQISEQLRGGRDA